jgi:zinc/manganese transport system permease protein
MHWLFEPGFFSSQPVHTAFVIGSVVAVVSAVVGVFTVLRGQSFAGHTLTDVSTAGGSAAFLLGISPLLGFVGMGLLGAGTIDTIGTQRVKGRDLATGIVLGAATGIAALLLYYDTTNSTTTGATQTILFGSIFTIDPSTIPIVIAFSVIAVAIIIILYRPLLLASTSNELAAARGVPARLIGLGFMAALAVAVGLSALAIGAILSTALLIGPAAAALRLTNRTGSALIIAAVIGVSATWVGVLLAYDSYYWGSSHNGYPVSFFIVVLSFLAYLSSGLPLVRTLTNKRTKPPAATVLARR